MYRVILFVSFVSYASCLVIQGQCEKNLTAYDGYNDPTKLEGNWYEIARLPNDIEKGDCPYIRFTTVDLGIFKAINVTVQEVVDGKLSVRNGQVVERGVYGYKISFTDGVSIYFYFKKTDYTDYAVAYSCVDVTSNTTSVFGWQLSRTSTLSTAAKNAIKTVIAETPGLNSTWKINSHSAQACGGAGTIMASLTLLFFGLFVKEIV